MQLIRFITVAFLSLIIVILTNSYLDHSWGEKAGFSHNLFNGESTASAQITVKTPDGKEPNTLLTAPSLSTARSTEFNSKTNSNLLLSQAKVRTLHKKAQR